LLQLIYGVDIVKLLLDSLFCKIEAWSSNFKLTDFEICFSLSSSECFNSLSQSILHLYSAVVAVNDSIKSKP